MARSKSHRKVVNTKRKKKAELITFYRLPFDGKMRLGVIPIQIRKRLEETCNVKLEPQLSGILIEAYSDGKVILSFYKEKESALERLLRG